MRDWERLKNIDSASGKSGEAQFQSFSPGAAAKVDLDLVVAPSVQSVSALSLLNGTIGRAVGPLRVETTHSILCPESATTGHTARPRRFPVTGPRRKATRSVSSTQFGNFKSHSIA